MRQTDLDKFNLPKKKQKYFGNTPEELKKFSLFFKLQIATLQDGYKEAKATKNPNEAKRILLLLKDRKNELEHIKYILNNDTNVKNFL